MPRTTRTYSVRDDRDHLSVSNYWSRTYDVLAVVGDEEDATLDVIATFDTFANAQAFVNETKDDRYIVAIRPPAGRVTEALDWLHAVTRHALESIPSGER